MTLEPSNKIRIAIADDHELIRMGLTQIIEDTHDFELVVEAVNGEDLLQKIDPQNLDVALLDITMPQKSGWDVMEEIDKRYPDLKVIILSVSPEEDYAMQFYKAGAVGYMTKDSAQTELVDAIRKVANGGKYVSPNIAEKFVSVFSKGWEPLPHEKLSPREFQIFLKIASGISLTHIADELNLAVPTIGTYRTRILMKLSVENNSQIIKYAYQNKLIQ
jgi:two-component system, NarL family, invasion response regulator UvrY